MNASFRVDEDRLRQIRKVTEVCRAITYAASLDEVLRLTVERAADLLTAEKSLLMVANDDGALALRSSHGIDAALAQRFNARLDEAVVPRLAEFLDAQAESFLGVPLVVAGAIKGILVVIRPASSSGAEHDEWVLSALADQAAIALEQKHRDQIGEFREQLMGIVGHDLRTPLNTVLSAAELLLLSEGLGAKETELARKIARSASLAGRLIDQVLDLTRSRLGGGIPIDPRPLDLSDVCRQVVSEIELTHPDRPLRVDLVGDLGGVWDRDRLYQLLENLVRNAVQHGEPRSPIDLRVHGDATEIVIEVASRGEPIPPAMLPVIFDAFRQARTAHPSRAGGLGLGLFIAQEIARSHGGSITVTSSESDGTTFRVRLPRAAVSAI
jgi:signal transduction histidine kinase